MSKVISMERRLRSLEGYSASAPYAHLTDDELEAQIAEIHHQLVASGIVFPDGFEEMPYAERIAWAKKLDEE